MSNAQQKKLIYPKCLGYGGFDGNICSYSSLGFLVPCCWIQQKEDNAFLTMLGFYDQEYHVDNFEQIEHIFLTEPWKQLRDILNNKPELAPKTCHKECGMSLDDYKRHHSHKTWLNQ